MNVLEEVKMHLLNKTADRWLRQAQSDYKGAEWNLEGQFYSIACFMAQQSAVKALRAFMFLNSEDAIESKSVVDLLDRAMTYEERFRSLVAGSARLDLYYKTSRFPDALPGGIPSEVMTERDAKEAIQEAYDVLSIVEKVKKDYVPDSL